MRNKKSLFGFIIICSIGLFASFLGSYITSTAHDINDKQKTHSNISIIPGDRHEEYSGTLNLGNSVSEIMYGGKNLFLLKDYICADEKGITYYSYDENSNLTNPILITDSSNTSNLNLFDTILYYVDDNKIISIDIQSGENSLIYQAPEKINMMYVINGSDILYSTDSSVYNYNMHTQQLNFITNTDNTTSFIPCDNGIIFIKQNTNNSTYSLCVNDKILISNIEKTFETDTNSLFFYENTWQTSDNYEYEYKKISLNSLFNSFSTNKIINITQEQKKVISNKKSTRGATTITEVLAKAYSFFNNRWSPLKDIRSDIFSGGFTLAAGSMQVGVPYSQPIQGGYVGFNLSLDDFNKEAQNPNSKLYTAKGTDGCIYYGSDCSGFISYCMNHSRLTTVGINKAYKHLGKASVSNIKPGDVFNRTSYSRHVILITAIDSSKICTLEQTVPYIKYKETPISQIDAVFYSKNYTVYRNPELIQ